MIINLKPINIEYYNLFYYSESFKISGTSQFDMLNIINDYNFINLVDDTNVYIDKVPNNAILKLRISPQLLLKSQSFSIEASNQDISLEKITVKGSINVISLLKYPTFLLSNPNSLVSLNETSIKLFLDQNKFSTGSVAFTSDILMQDDSCFITSYSIKSRNGIRIGTDKAKVMSAVSFLFNINSNLATLSLVLTNPNADKHPLDDYEFEYENQYMLSFTKDIIAQSKTYKMNFYIDIDFKTSVPNIIDKRIQTATIDPYHLHSLVTYDFETDFMLESRQVKFGTDKVYSIPTKTKIIIPSAMKLPFEEQYKSLEISISAIGLVNSGNHYTLKMVIEPDLYKNRTLRTMQINVPLNLEIRGRKHIFNLPIKLNG